MGHLDSLFFLNCSPSWADTDRRFSAGLRRYELAEEENTRRRADQRGSVGYCISNDLI
ncbi:MAG: hypothetical protein WB820_15580 [Rhodoplanes sp.]